jgi:hypothetical protein
MIHIVSYYLLLAYYGSFAWAGGRIIKSFVLVFTSYHGFQAHHYDGTFETGNRRSKARRC